jgi:hypothetical protein
MTQKNNKEEMFWKEIFSAKDAEKISQEKTCEMARSVKIYLMILTGLPLLVYEKKTSKL